MSRHFHWYPGRRTLILRYETRRRWILSLRTKARVTFFLNTFLVSPAAHIQISLLSLWTFSLTGLTVTLTLLFLSVPRKHLIHLLTHLLQDLLPSLLSFFENQPSVYWDLFYSDSSLLESATDSRGERYSHQLKEGIFMSQEHVPRVQDSVSCMHPIK